jgi:predicted TIM-barrel fold metal-dependent hydrolase
MILHWDAGTLVLEGVGPDEVPDDFVWDERVGRARAPAHAYYAFVMDLHRRGVPLDDRIYYPVYAKCSELGLPISVNTGIPGPPAPARTQDPLLLDEVCLFFPELTVIMAHGADPWWNVAIRLMLKYRNLYLMTSAFAPKYFPQELITFMNTRGKEKILFASDHPVLSMERTVNEAREMTNLKPGVLEKFLYDNAWKVLFEKRFGPSTSQG